MPDRVIATKRANALVEDAAAQLPPLGEVVPGFEAVDGVLAAFKRAHGGLWVGGRATLTPGVLTFQANAVNRAVQSGPLDVAVPLAAISDVTIHKGFVTDIIAVRTARSTLKIRCYGAAAFADQINVARG